MGRKKVGRGDTAIDPILLEHVSHQLKTPLNAVLGFSETLLASPSLSDTERQAAATINASGKKLLTMINDILDIEKIQTGRSTCEKTSVDMVHFIETIQSAIKPKLARHAVSFHVRLSEGIPRYFLADEKKFLQAVINFLTETIDLNAKKNIFFTIHARENFLVINISNEPVEDIYDDDSGCFEPVIDLQKKHLKPALVVAALIIRAMGGQALIRKITGQNTGFNVRVMLEKTENDDVISGNYVEGSDMRNESDTGGFYDLSRIPGNLRQQMQDAVKRVRFDILTGLINEVEKLDAPFARRLTNLAKDYDCESILEMLGRET